jgi:sarcosine oxidase subunit gamma
MEPAYMLETAACSWTRRSAWSGIVEAGRIGVSGSPGVTALTLDGLGLATLITKSESTGLDRTLQQLVALELPQTSSVTQSGGYAAIWAGPGKWLFRAPRRTGFSELLAPLSAHAAVINQSDGRAALRLSGSRVHEVLAKGSMVDLHPSSFPVRATALTAFAHIGVQIWRDEDGPDGAVFEVLVARSMAGSFWSWVAASAAEYGCDVGIG